ncbi:MAG: hypothetical protein KDA85_15085, partial [Planctomycetaceae bacterium]|nr:hypothetical protein [Planctomycetaceae bacterium]
LKFPAVRPAVWVADVGQHLVPIPFNAALGQINVRDVTVPGYPVRLTVPVRNESDAPRQIAVRLSIDGQRMAEHQRELAVPARAVDQVSFELRLREAGTHLVTAELSTADDSIATDNTAHAAIHVAPPVPVLLINGTSSADPLDTETFFAALALSPPGTEPPWVDAITRDAADVTIADMDRADVIVLADVTDLPAESVTMLPEAIRAGKGLLISCGGNTTRQTFGRLFRDTDLLPQVVPDAPQDAPDVPDQFVRIDPATLQAGWLADRFKSTPEAGLLSVSFHRWWKLQPRVAPTSPAAQPDDQNSAERTPLVTLATLTNGDPLLLQTGLGQGQILLLTSTISRDWNELPLNGDFVPFLHEAIFSIARPALPRNIPAGSPLFLPSPASPERAGAAVATADDDRDQRNGGLVGQSGSSLVDSYRFRFPDDRVIVPEAAGTTEHPLLSTRGTFLPGVVKLQAAELDAAAPALPVPPLDLAVINYDHREDQMQELTPADYETLSSDQRVRFVKSMDELS